MPRHLKSMPAKDYSSARIVCSKLVGESTHCPEAGFLVEQLEELVADPHGFVCLCDRLASLALQSGKCSNSIYVLRDNNALVMDLIHHVRLAVCHVKDVLPKGYFPHISSHPSQVSHHLGHRVHAIDSIRSPDWC